MADSQSAPLTFHKVRELCESGDPQAWRGFLRFYTPLFMHLLSLYAPQESDAPQIAETTLRALGENNFTLLRGMPRASEREFLSEIRGLLLETALIASLKPPDEHAINPGKWNALAEGLPLMHQEMMFFRLAGYTDAAIEHMLRTAPTVAHKAFERLAPEYATALKLVRNRCPWPQEWLALLREARTSKRENCPVMQQFLRVHDGQTSWYDKEPLEKHVAGCLHCLDRWTGLHELGYWRHAAPPVRDALIEDLLRAVPLKKAEAKAKRGWFSRS